MTEGIWSAIIAGICTIICAYIGGKSMQAHKKEGIRREEALLSLQMIDATMQLSLVASNALTNGHNNGNVEQARIAAQKAQERYKEFMQTTTAYAVSK